MTDKELKEFEAWRKAEDEKRRAEQLEGVAERNLKIDMLSKMNKEAVGEAYIHYANQMKKSEEFEVESDAVLEAYRLICDIEYLDMWVC